MKIVRSVALGLFLAAAGSCLAAAQDASGPPKVLQIDREFIKPGKAGALHDRSEGNFVQAMERAKWPTHYVALNSMSGKSRALYLIGYSSFADIQKDGDAMDKNPALGAELDRLNVADGELLDAYDQFLLTYDEDDSYRAHSDLSHDRFIEVSSYHVRPGHRSEWKEIVKMVIAAHQKAGTSAHWATYELAYGGDEEYVILSGDKGLAEIDQGFAEGKQFNEAMGEEGMKKLSDLVSSAIESSDSELFAINPRQSYPPEDWVKANPDFWKPKPMAAPAAKPTAPEKKTP
ncbi:MAG TPA: hypothetical protein VMD55_07015 [Terracidiphilus sp.]|nr:hypothetical protein [Terracidiphilus sp.]